MKAGLVLTGGGARGAYQAGVLRGIALLCKSKKLPFSVVSGVSAGAINGGYMAACFDDFQNGTHGLCSLWENLKFNNVVKTQPSALFKTASSWILQSTIGTVTKKPPANHLMDTTPLKELVSEKIPFHRIQDGINKGAIKGFAVSTTNYASGSEVIFYQTHGETKDWVRANRVSRKEKITSEHVLASAAIPLFFPPVKIGSSYFGDGSIRSRSPLSPAIHLGSEKILAIGVKQRKNKKTLLDLNQALIDSVSVADIAGILLNAIFLDSLDSDLERLERINRTIQKQQDSSGELRPIQYLAISPSQDLGALAKDSINQFPRGLKFLFSGIGSRKDRGLELLSYMSFEENYTSKLVQIGIEDANKNRDKILEFFEK